MLGFAGIGLVVFDVVWGFLTSGGHGPARGRAGIGRSVIMLAYAVVPTALLAWQQAAHGGQLRQAAPGSRSGNGMAYLGDALVPAMLAAGGARPPPGACRRA